MFLSKWFQNEHLNVGTEVDCMILDIDYATGIIDVSLRSEFITESKREVHSHTTHTLSLFLSFFSPYNAKSIFKLRFSISDNKICLFPEFWASARRDGSLSSNRISETTLFDCVSCNDRLLLTLFRFSPKTKKQTPFLKDLICYHILLELIGPKVWNSVCICTCTWS
jgi:hypothetical protein